MNVSSLGGACLAASDRAGRPTAAWPFGQAAGDRPGHRAKLGGFQAESLQNTIASAPI